MVYTSLPVHLDPPNWNHHHQEQQPFLPQEQQLAAGAEGGENSNDRRRLQQQPAADTKAPQPEQALKCPRCESTNTKFCYFNNYSLSQPRHFCKTCRRYWTRGGALRNVPVGGGCRRNKRSRIAGASSKPDHHKPGSSGGGGGGALITSAPLLPFLSCLKPLPDYGSGNTGLDPFRYQQIQQQLPFFPGLIEPTTVAVHSSPAFYPSTVGTSAKLAPPVMKMEQISQSNTEMRNGYVGIDGRSSDHYWRVGGGLGIGSVGDHGGGGGGGGGLGWTDLAGFGNTSAEVLF